MAKIEIDNDELADGLRGLVLAEPPLGFSPDEVATRAARRLRDRRVAMGTGLTVAVVAVSAVAFAANGAGTGQVGGGTTESPPSSGLVSTPAEVPPTHDLTAQSARNGHHLRQVLGGVVPGATQVKVGEFDQSYPDATDEWAMLTSEVTFRDDAGPAYFTLTVAGPQAASAFVPLASRCDPHPDWDNEHTIVVPTLPNGQPLRCEKLPQPDGSTVVVEETGVSVGGDDVDVVRLAGLDAMHYRTDGSTVNIVNDDLISGHLAEEYGETKPDGTPKIGTRPRFPLTEQQLVALVTDPAFNLG